MDITATQGGDPLGLHASLWVITVLGLTPGMYRSRQTQKRMGKALELKDSVDHTQVPAGCSVAHKDGPRQL